MLISYFRKVSVPYPVVVPGPSVSYSAPVPVSHGLYDSQLSYGSGIYSSYRPSPSYYSSGVKVITSSPYKSYGGYGYNGGYSGGYHGGYSSGYHGGYSSGFHGGISSHGGGLGFSIGSKYGWPSKFGLKYSHGW